MILKMKRRPVLAMRVWRIRVEKIRKASLTLLLSFFSDGYCRGFWVKFQGMGNEVGAFQITWVAEGLRVAEPDGLFLESCGIFWKVSITLPDFFSKLSITFVYSPARRAVHTSSPPAGYGASISRSASAVSGLKRQSHSAAVVVLCWGAENSLSDNDKWW